MVRCTTPIVSGNWACFSDLEEIFSCTSRPSISSAPPLIRGTSVESSPAGTYQRSSGVGCTRKIGCCSECSPSRGRRGRIRSSPTRRLRRSGDSHSTVSRTGGRRSRSRAPPGRARHERSSGTWLISRQEVPPEWRGYGARHCNGPPSISHAQKRPRSRLRPPTQPCDWLFLAPLEEQPGRRSAPGGSLTSTTSRPYQGKPGPGACSPTSILARSLRLRASADCTCSRWGFVCNFRWGCPPHVAGITELILSFSISRHSSKWMVAPSIEETGKPTVRRSSTRRNNVTTGSPEPRGSGSSDGVLQTSDRRVTSRSVCGPSASRSRDPRGERLSRPPRGRADQLAATLSATCVFWARCSR